MITAMLLLFLLVAAVLGLAMVAAVVVLVHGTVTKNRMGINLQTGGRCPRCGTSIPAIRRPKNTRQALWGGTTCAGCDAELDKWGREIVLPAAPRLDP